MVLIWGTDGSVLFCSGRDGVGMGGRRSPWVRGETGVGFVRFWFVRGGGGVGGRQEYELAWFLFFGGDDVGRRPGYGLVRFGGIQLSG